MNGAFTAFRAILKALEEGTVVKKIVSNLADAMLLIVFIALSVHAVWPSATSLSQEELSTLPDVVEKLRRDERHLETLLRELEEDQETLRRLMEQPTGAERHERGSSGTPR